VETSASTATASGASVPRDAVPAAIAACSAALVSWSRTTVWASTPLMNTGTWRAGGGRARELGVRADAACQAGAVA
jgi:hypothetical protein